MGKLHEMFAYIVCSGVKITAKTVYKKTNLQRIYFKLNIRQMKILHQRFDHFLITVIYEPNGKMTHKLIQQKHPIR